MVNAPLLLLIFVPWLLAREWPATDATASAEHGATAGNMADALYAEIGLQGKLSQAAFTAGYHRMEHLGQHGAVLAIADMSQPSTARRFYVIDMENKVLLLRTFVAHGQGSGGLYCTRFSNREGSHATSKGLYRVGAGIESPKHGPALLLHGLERGVNDQALEREVIIHGADYVGEDFIAEHGRSGRSWGCPAVSRRDMPRMLELLANGGLLYVHGG